MTAGHHGSFWSELDPAGREMFSRLAGEQIFSAGAVLMREGETEFVASLPGVTVEHAEEQFLNALAGITDPERKRHIIGEEFVRVQ